MLHLLKQISKSRSWSKQSCLKQLSSGLAIVRSLRGANPGFGVYLCSSSLLSWCRDRGGEGSSISLRSTPGDSQQAASMPMPCPRSLSGPRLRRERRPPPCCCPVVLMEPRSEPWRLSLCHCPAWRANDPRCGWTTSGDNQPTGRWPEKSLHNYHNSLRTITRKRNRSVAGFWMRVVENERTTRLSYFSDFYSKETCIKTHDVGQRI